MERAYITEVVLLPLKILDNVGVIEPAWDPGGKRPITRGGSSYLEVRTNVGVTGIRPNVDAELIEVAKSFLLGAGPFEIEYLSDCLEYYTSGAPYKGRAGFDIALWDLVGKFCNQPLYKLWGGNRDRMPGYASLIALSNTRERARQAVYLRDCGFRALKVRIHHSTIESDVETVAQIREALGPKIVIMVDANQAQSSGGWQPGIQWDYRRALDPAREL